MKTALISMLSALSCTAAPSLILRYDKPPVYHDIKWSTKYMDPSVAYSHTDWQREPLPIGNGRIGAMVFGDPLNERIQFNENSLWTGGANESGKYDIDDPAGFGSYQNFGDLFITIKGINSYENFSRELDLATGIHTTRWTSDGVNYTREVFASHPADTIVIHITADQPGKIDAEVKLAGAHDESSTLEQNHIAFDGVFENGLRYAALVTAATDGGEVKPKDGMLQVSGNAVTLFLNAATDYAMDPTKNFRSGLDPDLLVGTQRDFAKENGYAKLRAGHIKDFTFLMGRVVLDIGSDKPELSIPDRLERYRSGLEDPHLESLLFQFGRYLLISCSRDALPGNLQGLWNDMNHPAWFCDYHTNINIQMNYWPVGAANLSECNVPLFNWIEASIPGSRVATRKAFGEDTLGWTMRTSVNIFGGNGWEWNLPSSAWFAQHYWEHYAFTGDEVFLRERALSIFEEVSKFWLDHLVEKDGRLIVPDGWSPEHGPREDGVAHDQQIVWDLFTNLLDTVAVLGIENELVAEVRAAREKLLGPQVGSWGQLMEWMVERPVLEKSQHRHTSNLFGVYPGRQITLKDTPEWANAALLSLASRGNAGDSRRSWTWGWRCALWARLGMSSQSSDMIRGQLTWNTLPNLLASHPPFQLDGNSGITAGICEMLVQSHAGVIHVLPAIPIKKKWGSGSFSGVVARGGFEVSASWGDRMIQSAGIDSKLGNTAVLNLPIDAPSILVTPDQGCDAFPVDRNHDGTYAFETKAGYRYAISWTPVEKALYDR